MDKLNDIAKRLGVEPASLRGLFEEMVQAETGMEYADVAAQLTATPASSAQTTDEAAQVAQLNADLAQRWGVTEDVVSQRLAQLNSVYTALPEAQRAQYESIDGIVSLFNVVSATAPAPQAAPVQPANGIPEEGVVRRGVSDAALKGISPASLLTGSNRTASYAFDDLMTMSDADYAQLANSGQLLEAFNAGRVRDTQQAIRPGAEQTSAVSGQYMR
jgi:hypothetical protein